MASNIKPILYSGQSFLTYKHINYSAQLVGPLFPAEVWPEVGKASHPVWAEVVHTIWRPTQSMSSCILACVCSHIIHFNTAHNYVISMFSCRSRFWKGQNVLYCTRFISLFPVKKNWKQTWWHSSRVFEKKLLILSRCEMFYGANYRAFVFSKILTQEFKICKTGKIHKLKII